jgi:hypothetical protein
MTTRIPNLPALGIPNASSVLTGATGSGSGGTAGNYTGAALATYFTNTAAAYTAPGTSAVSRTLGAKLGEQISLADFGAKGDGATDDTAAVNAFLTAVSTYKLPGFIPAPSVAYLIGPITFPAVQGMTIRGQSMARTVFKPLNSGQSFMFYLPYGCSGLDLSEIYLDPTNLTVGNYPTWMIKCDAAQSVLLHDIAIATCNNGFWFNQGGYYRCSNLQVKAFCANGTSGTAFQFGGSYTGSGGTLQFTESTFKDLYCAGPAVNTSSQSAAQAARGTSFSFQSGAAFLELVSPITAGGQYGVYISDNQSGGVSTRPDGITVTNGNMDYVGSTAVIISAAGLVRLFDCAFRSLGSNVASVSNCGQFYARNTDFYASANGVTLLGGNGDVLFNNCKSVCNGWPSNTGGTNLSVYGANGRIQINNGELGNASATSPTWSPNGATNQADYGLYWDASATGQLAVNGTRFQNLRVATSSGLTSSGTPRSGLAVVNTVDAGMLSRNGGQITATSDGSGNILIPHGLLAKPATAVVTQIGAANYPRPAVVAVDATNIQITLVNSSGTAVTSTSATMNWQASI